MKIRRVFNISDVLDYEKKSWWVASVLPIFYQRDRHIVDDHLQRHIDLCEKRITDGALFNVRFIHTKKWWAEVTTGIEKEHVTSRGTSLLKAGRAGMDDIVLSAGYNFIGAQMQAVLYGLAGFPTRRTVTLSEAQDTLVGTRFFSAGVGVELSYSFINTHKRSLVGIFQNRFLHFFTRNWQPVLPLGGKIQPGNVTDLLLSIQYREKKNILEGGYNATFFTHQALLLKTATIASDSFLRNSMYVTFNRVFFRRNEKPLLLGFGCNIGRSHKFDTKIASVWLNMTVVF